MSQGFYTWSHTASSNAGSDASIDWHEGQSPSSINDSARAMMARTAEYRDDVTGATVTAGSNTAYTVASNQVFDSLTHLAGQIIAFTPHVTNGATVLLNVDGLGQKPLRSSPGVELQAGVLIQGTPYLCIFNNTDGAFYLQSFYANPYSVPLGGMLPFIAPTTPNSSFVFPFGQGISRSTYSALFALIGTTYGTGDGSTTFNIPDVRGRVIAGVDNMGGSAAGRLTSASGMGTGLLGQAGGAETETLTTAQIPAHTHANTLSDPGHAHSGTVSSQGTVQTGAGGQPGLGGNNTGAVSGTITVNANTTGVTINNASQGGGGAHPNVMPAICCNLILRVI